MNFQNYNCGIPTEASEGGHFFFCQVASLSMVPSSDYLSYLQLDLIHLLLGHVGSSQTILNSSNDVSCW